MSLAERLSLYQQIEAHRQRPLIVYVTNERVGVPGQIAADVLPEIMDQLGKLPDDAKALDFLIVSNGGDPTVAFRIMTLIRERVSKVAVIIPQAAYSAATLFALGADEIIMHANGNLGPVDPQIHVPTDKGEKHFGSQDVTAFFHFVRHEVGVTDQTHLSSLLEKLCTELGPVSLGLQARASQLSVSLGEKLLRAHMTSEADSTRATGISESLCKDFYDHGYAVGRKEAKQLGLKVVDEATTEKLAWSAWSDFEAELDARNVFTPIMAIMQSPEGAKLSSPIPQITAPAGTPPALLQNAYLAAIQTVHIDPIEVDLVLALALVESPRLSSRCIDKLRIFANRNADMNVEFSTMLVSRGWKPITILQQPAA